MAGRVSQAPVEVVEAGSPRARTSQVVTEVVQDTTKGLARISQVPVEVVEATTTRRAMLSQVVVEVVYSASLGRLPLLKVG